MNSENILMEINDLEMLVGIEKENIHCLYTALIEAEDEPKNYGAMMSGIVIRLVDIQDRLNTLFDVVKAEKEKSL